MARAPLDTIPAPMFPRPATWIGDPVHMHEQRGHPVLVEFWDFCRPNSIRTLPYLRGWDERYRPLGLQVVGVHAAGFEPSTDPDAVRDAVTRLAVPYPVIVDAGLEVWQAYENLGWPARYLFDAQGHLFEFHYGEGAYAETERAIQELLGAEREPLAPVRPEDDPAATLAVQSDDVPGPYSGPYEAGAVWAVLDGAGTVVANGAATEVDHPGAYLLIDHGGHSTAGVLELEIGPGVECHATCFTPGLAP